MVVELNSYGHDRNLESKVVDVVQAQMSVMMILGVDGIITDEPGLVTQGMKLREQLSPIGRLLVWIAGESGLLRGVDKSSSVDNA